MAISCSGTMMRGCRNNAKYACYACNRSMCHTHKLDVEIDAWPVFLCPYCAAELRVTGMAAQEWYEAKARSKEGVAW